MLQIGVDVGYSTTKIVTAQHRAIRFPSLVGSATPRDGTLGQMFHGSDAAPPVDRALDDLHVRWTPADGPAQTVFVGDLARRESQDVAYLFTQTRTENPFLPVLFATASALCADASDHPIHLATGLPLGYLAAHKAEWDRMLHALQGSVEFLSGPFKGRVRTVRFARVSLFPQGGAALYDVLFDPEGHARPALAHLMEEGGIVVLLDWGHHTTDAAAIELGGGQIRVKEDMSRTIDIGVSRVHKAIADSLMAELGIDVPLTSLERWVESGSLRYRGKTIPLGPYMQKAVTAVATAIANRLMLLWGEQAAFVSALYHAGGGADMLSGALQAALGIGASTVLPDPQWANARGYRTMAVLADLRRHQTATTASE